ncbi:hypothetical protein GOODEAATRI_001847, partial [Goodea atripinnis]
VEKESMQTTYTENECSMLRYVYDCVFFVARKPSELQFNGLNTFWTLHQASGAGFVSLCQEYVGYLDCQVHNAQFCHKAVLLESMARAGGVSPQSLLTLLGSRCRKRPCCFENEEADFGPKILLSDSGKHAKDVLKEPSSGSFKDERMSCSLSRNKRPREDSVGSDSVTPTGNAKVCQHRLLLH